MATRSSADARETLTDEQAKRKAVVLQMLAERDMRRRVSQAEIQRIRGEGRC